MWPWPLSFLCFKLQSLHQVKPFFFFLWILHLPLEILVVFNYIFQFSCFSLFTVRHVALTWIPYLKSYPFSYPIFCNWQVVPFCNRTHGFTKYILSTKAFIGLEQKSGIISNSYSQLWLYFCITGVTKNIDAWTWNAYQKFHSVVWARTQALVLLKISLGSFTIQSRNYKKLEWAFLFNLSQYHWHKVGDF